MASHLDNILIALDALLANRLRAFLSLLGIIIGVAAVIVIGAAVKSGKSIIFDELMTFGLKSLWVHRSFNEGQPGKSIKMGSGIDNDDLDALIKNSRTIDRITPVTERQDLWARNGTNFIKMKLLAVGTDYAVINNDSVFRGRFIMKEDLESRRSVCVIGRKVADKLFGIENPLGKEIQIGKDKYTTIGILEKKDRDFLASIGSIGGDDANNRVIIPISTYQRKYNSRQIGLIQAEATAIDSAKTAEEELKNILIQRHKGQYAYNSETMQQYIETANSIIRIVSWIGGVAAVVSLVVGGIGIMNIMTISVVERTREIGIRKAMGARRADIMVQFLSESVFISLLGGLCGAGAGIAIISIIQILSHKPRLLAPEYVAVALTVSILTGIFSGLYPAYRAASLDPVKALRYE